MIAVINLGRGRAQVQCDCGFSRTLENGQNALGVADHHLDVEHPGRPFGVSFKRASEVAG